MSKEIGIELSYDVAVIGGGAVGLGYAIRVKRDNPELRVLVLEKAKEPRFKIGESTLSVTIENLLELGFTMPQLRRLFTVKSGLGFWYTDSATDELVSPVDVCNTEETFQVERRPMEIALTVLAQSCGVEIRSGTDVSTGRSRLDGPDPMLVMRGSSGTADPVRCRLVCDASGPASVLARSRGTHRKQKHINTNAYWSHFRKTASPGVPGWDAPMTHHICFPQGWFWFISLCSWESSPTPNLTAMIGALLKDRRDEEDMPDRQEWASRFGCTHSLRVSIGVSPRSDLDYSPSGRARERFWHYVDAYPAIQQIMRCYEEVPDPYQGKPAYGYLKEIEHYSTSYAGAGFLAVGDAAFFVNPLFSFGLAFGMFCAKEAARATAGHLNDPARGDFARYDRLLHSVYRALSTENEALYRSWASPAGFEHVLMAMLAGALREVRNRAEGLVHEDVPYRLLEPRHAKVFTDLVARTRDAGSHRADRSPQIEAVTRRYLEELRTEPETIEARLGRFLTYYDDNLVRHENAAEVAQPGVFTAVSCPACRQAVNATLGRCPACGQDMNPGVTSSPVNDATGEGSPG
jgi:flavin-dependent dehydrogenase